MRMANAQNRAEDSATGTNESAESVYLRQHATIAAAIELLQATLDGMANPEFCSILWGDVTEHAHVAAAANTLVESLTES